MTEIKRNKPKDVIDFPSDFANMDIKLNQKFTFFLSFLNFEILLLKLHVL